MDDVGAMHVLDGEQYLVEYKLYVSRGHILVRANDLRQIRVHKIENSVNDVSMTVIMRSHMQHNIRRRRRLRQGR